MGRQNSNIVEITIETSTTQFDVTAGTSELYTGYADVYAAGEIFDLGPVGSVTPSPSYVGTYQVGALLFFGTPSPTPYLALYGSNLNPTFTLTFTDNEGHTQTLNSGDANRANSGSFTLFTFNTHPAYVPMTTNQTYVITAGSGGDSGVSAPVLTGVLNPLGSQILLTWTCATASITNFLLYKNANNNGFALYQTLSGSVFQYLDTITDDPVDDIDSAVYYVVAVKAGAYSGPSNEVDNEVN